MVRTKLSDVELLNKEIYDNNNKLKFLSAFIIFVESIVTEYGYTRLPNKGSLNKEINVNFNWLEFLGCVRDHAKIQKCLNCSRQNSRSASIAFVESIFC